MALSDHGYKLLFSQPCIVSSLLRDIVPALDGGWTDILALEHMTPVRSELISNTLQRRHGDMIWRIPRKDRHDLFLVLMLEFQSRTDHAMALRLTTYRSLLYEDLLARTPLKARQTLPAVVPLVIHTSVRPWHARRDLAELIDPVPPPLTPYQPRQRYLLIDARTQAHNQLLPTDSLARLIFRLEHNHGLHDTTRIIDRLGRLMQAPPVPGSPPRHPGLATARATAPQPAGSSDTPIRGSDGIEHPAAYQTLYLERIRGTESPPAGHTTRPTRRSAGRANIGPKRRKD
ncbi:MAG: hypothetical protein KER_02346 [Kerstersia gyiorum]|uniref:Rpn family recombination-promoting nuclease/putative transposase n=1 Tax=Kerstersia gyiorum TaxID=206506 RepID=UPI0030CE3811